MAPQIAPYQMVLRLFLDHGLPEERMSEVFHLIESNLTPEWQTRFLTNLPAAEAIKAERSLIHLQGRSPKTAMERERLLLHLLSEALGGDAARAKILLQSLLTTFHLN